MNKFAIIHMQKFQISDLQGIQNIIKDKEKVNQIWTLIIRKVNKIMIC